MASIPSALEYAIVAYFRQASSTNKTLRWFIYKEGRENPAIVHFTGHDKPWNTLAGHPYQDLYMELLNKSILMKTVRVKWWKREDYGSIKLQRRIRWTRICIICFSPRKCWATYGKFWFYVIDDEITIANKRLMRETIKGYDASLHFMTIDKKYFADAVEVIVSGNRVLSHRDSRIIPRQRSWKNSLSWLWHDRFDGYFRAVGGWSIRLYLSCGRRCWLPSSSRENGCRLWLNKIFQFGLYADQHGKMAFENVTKRVLRYIHDNPEKLKFHDQDALNAILHDQWLQLHPKWNAQSYIMKREVEHPDPEGKRNIFKPDATLRSSIILDISNLGVKSVPLRWKSIMKNTKN